MALLSVPEMQKMEYRSEMKQIIINYLVNQDSSWKILEPANLKLDYK
jgi:hypothetical protein